MSTEKMREEFEAAYMADITSRHGHESAMNDGWLDKSTNGDYRSFRAYGAWWGWQASRSAIEVELPNPGYEVMDSDHSGQCQYRIIAASSIESLGLRVKP